jgi:hypothetical protein
MSMNDIDIDPQAGEHCRSEYVLRPRSPDCIRHAIIWLPVYQQGKLESFLFAHHMECRKLHCHKRGHAIVVVLRGVTNNLTARKIANHKHTKRCMVLHALQSASISNPTLRTDSHSDNTPTMENGQHCSACSYNPSSNEPSLMTCDLCKKRLYCSKTCQRQDWSTYKRTCSSYIDTIMNPDSQTHIMNRSDAFASMNFREDTRKISLP